MQQNTPTTAPATFYNGFQLFMDNVTGIEEIQYSEPYYQKIMIDGIEMKFIDHYIQVLDQYTNKQQIKTIEIIYRKYNTIQSLDDPSKVFVMLQKYTNLKRLKLVFDQAAFNDPNCLQDTLDQFFIDAISVRSYLEYIDIYISSKWCWYFQQIEQFYLINLNISVIKYVNIVWQCATNYNDGSNQFYTSTLNQQFQIAYKHYQLSYYNFDVCGAISNGFYDDITQNTDLQLHCTNSTCMECSDSTQGLDFCTSCHPSRSLTNTGLCNCLGLRTDLYEDKGGVAWCDYYCHARCLTCSQDRNCTACRNHPHRIDEPSQNCPCRQGYKEIENNFENPDCECSSRHRNINNDCLCKPGFTEFLPFQDYCQCDFGYYKVMNTNPIDEQDFECYKCGYISPYTIKLNDDYTKIIFQFEEELEVRYGDNPTIYQTPCELIFTSYTVSLLGTYNTCVVYRLDKKLEIILGLEPTIFIDMKFEIQSFFVYQRGCQLHYNYSLQTLQPPDNAQSPISILNDTEGEMSICSEISLYEISTQNDGNKALLEYRWSLVSSSVPDTTDVELFLDSHNQQVDITTQILVFPQNLLKSLSQYTFKLEYENFLGMQGESIRTINTSAKISINSKFKQEDVFQQYFVSQENIIEAQFEILDCTSADSETQVIQKSVQITWELIQEDTLQDPPQITKFTDAPFMTDANQNSVQYTIPQYKMNSLFTYYLKITVFLAAQDQFSQDLTSVSQMLLLVEQNPIYVYIQGGNRQSSYYDQLIIQGEAKDLDQILENQKDGLIYSWECLDVVTQKECLDINEEPIVIQQGQDNQQFVQKLFPPFQTMKFTMTVQKQYKESQQYSILVIIIEDQIPSFSVNLPLSFVQKSHNLNTDLKFDVDYQGDISTVIFSIKLLYKLDVVASKIFLYPTFTFQIWELFSDFTDSTQITLKIAIIDPQYFVPAQSSYTLNVNLSSSVGQITTDKNTGVGIKDVFNLDTINFEKPGSTLTYSYGIYQSLQLYQQDVINGNNSMQKSRYTIKLFQDDSSIQTILPRPLGNIDDQIIVEVQVSDQFGAISNTTLPISVEPMEYFTQEYVQIVQNLVNDNMNDANEISNLLILSLDMNQLDINQQNVDQNNYINHCGKI